jgi:hypothetical protein
MPFRPAARTVASTSFSTVPGLGWAYVFFVIAAKVGRIAGARSVVRMET